MRAILMGAVILAAVQVVAAQTAPGAPVKPGSPFPAGTRMVPAVRPPASVHAKTATRTSTAESAAARVDLPPVTDLPSLALTGQNGAVVQANTAMNKSGHWLMVYRAASCVPCDRLMTVLANSAASQPGQGLSYMVVVASKDKSALAAVQAQYAALNNATWMSDTTDQVKTALKPRGAPMLYAMNGNKIMWSVAGTLGDPAMVERMASAWVADAQTGVTAEAKPSAAATK